MKKNLYMQGYCCAVAKLIEKNEAVCTDAKELANEGSISNHSAKELRSMGVDEYDIQTFMKYGIITH